MDELTAFGLHYRRYLRGLELAFKYLPFLTNVSPFKTIERRMSPFFKQVHAMSGSMAAVLPQAGVPEFRRAWLDSHALFARHFLEYRRIDHDWVKKNVVVEEPALLKEVVERGGCCLHITPTIRIRFAAFWACWGVRCQPLLPRLKPPLFTPLSELGLSV
ncbi:hypothetical protein [Zoogloea sp.]|uniref:hypothetical protein n=1 Tax=Zoogloea sp. TaxID=49181 RepID=UPI001D840C93|nr:hypothetical protein [Zoogloea sp.]MBK6655090.1 hypothetical protein [Zoogloea sp.]